MQNPPAPPAPKPHRYAATNEAPIYSDANKLDAKGRPKSKVLTRLLLGSYVALRPLPPVNGCLAVSSMGYEGWMHPADLREAAGLRMHFLDVGQGDGVLVEIGSGQPQQYRFLVDAGPEHNMRAYLTKWKYQPLIKRGYTVHLDAIFVSHFDSDHYSGFTELLNDVNFTFGTLYHNGIVKCRKGSKDKPMPPDYNTGLGVKYQGPDGKAYLKTNFTDLPSLLALRDAGVLQDEFTEFVTAVEKAFLSGRLERVVRLQAGDIDLFAEEIDGQPFKVEILGPVCADNAGAREHLWLKSDSHTVNGHSLVLKLHYGTCTVLLGGDLNTDAEKHLMKHYRGQNPFECDVAKSCHHGSSEFTREFMALVNPLATVISSGDNELYAHPRADAVGCAGRYSRNPRPLVFSTELARSTNLKTDKIIFGMINLRSDGERIFMAQMKEGRDRDDPWDSYQVKPAVAGD